MKWVQVDSEVLEKFCAIDLFARADWARAIHKRAASRHISLTFLICYVGKLWTLDFGLWTLDFGLWTLDFGLWTLDFRPKPQDQRPKTEGPLTHAPHTFGARFLPLPFCAPRPVHHRSASRVRVYTSMKAASRQSAPAPHALVSHDPAPSEEFRRRRI